MYEMLKDLTKLLKNVLFKIYITFAIIFALNFLKIIRLAKRRNNTIDVKPMKRYVAMLYTMLPDLIPELYSAPVNLISLKPMKYLTFHSGLIKGKKLSGLNISKSISFLNYSTYISAFDGIDMA